MSIVHSRLYDNSLEDTLMSPYGRLGMIPDPNFGLEGRARAVRRAAALASASEAPVPLETAPVPVLAPLSQPPRALGATGAAASVFATLPEYIEDDDGGLLIFPVFVISEGGFALGSPKSSSAKVALGG